MYNLSELGDGTWDQYSGIPVLPEVKISTNYLNTDLFIKKYLILDTQSNPADFR